MGYNFNNATVENCYSTGEMNFNTTNFIAGAYSGGISGRNGSSTTKNCVALSNIITVPGAGAGRVVGGAGGMQNNYARADMLVNGSVVSDGTKTNSNGLDITQTEWHSASWWIDTALFDPAIWDIADGRLPILKGFPAGTQNPVVVP
ncbi:hypothetical protein R83H12_02760 [Fibrobacteria bacterium R8-3-H12]